MKLDIVCDGHAARIELAQVGPALTGTITSAEFGSGAVQATETSAGEISGTASLDGYKAKFNARIVGDQVSGEISYGWFFRRAFTGTAAP